MCTEIWIRVRDTIHDEASRPGDECWCALAECYKPEDRATAFADLGKIITTAYHQASDAAPPDQAEITVEVTFKRW